MVNECCASCHKEIPEHGTVRLGTDDGPIIHLRHYGHGNPARLARIDKIIEEIQRRQKKLGDGDKDALENSPTWC
jgi:hypothetical protein